MRNQRFAGAGAVALLLVAAQGLFATGAAASPISTSFHKGVLTVNGTTGNDSINITCSGGAVQMNAAPLPASKLCTQIKRIVLNGGGGSDQLYLNAMQAVDFPNFLGGTMNGQGGSYDSLAGSFANDKLNGGPGKGDNMLGGQGRDTFDGGPGGGDSFSDSGSGLIKLTPTELVSGGISQTFVNTETASVTGSGGPDTINASTYNHIPFLSGGDGNDTLIGSKQRDLMNGGPGIDLLSSGPGDDSLDGGDGNDTLNGGPGNDQVFDGVVPGPATLTDSNYQGGGTEGSDLLLNIEQALLEIQSNAGVSINASAFSGRAYLFGAKGNDVLIGGSGNDGFTPGDGADTVAGGGGNDAITIFTDQSETVTATQALGASTDNLSSLESLTLYSFASTPVTLDASTFPGPAKLLSGGGNDSITGTAFDDHLYGSGGGDTLVGLAGNDLLNGGKGSDNCDGGSGHNTFRSCESIT